MLFIGIRVGYVMGLPPLGVGVVDSENQLHGAQGILRITALHGRPVADRGCKRADLLIPGGITVVAGQLFLGITLVSVRVGANHGEGLGAIALGSAQYAAEDQAATLEIDIEMEAVPPLRGR